MARTYLERHLDSFENCDREELVKHALRALKDSLSQDKELTVDNTSLGISGLDEDFKLYEGQEIASWLETTFENKTEGEGDGDGTAEGGGESMEVDS